jgi:hypothetical protein
MDWIHVAQDKQKARALANSYQTWGSIKCRVLLNYLKNYQLINKVSTLGGVTQFVFKVSVLLHMENCPL